MDRRIVNIRRNEYLRTEDEWSFKYWITVNILGRKVMNVHGLEKLKRISTLNNSLKTTRKR